MRPAAEKLRILSLVPGRVRVHLMGPMEDSLDQIGARLLRVPGVEDVEVNRLTGNILIRFDSRTIGENRLLAELHKISDRVCAAQSPGPAPRSGSPRGDRIGQPVEGRSSSTSPLIRVGVRGLLGHAVVDSLWFGAGFLGEVFGLPLAGLGPLHVLMDLTVWGVALASGTGPSRSPARI